ncbi:MAG: 5-(carboxyamino)imidazole ribonucleotide synthase [Chitinophagales bacterium]|nr:5-(carboxyamino)imidazole ribonucleotide synthase [Chitinophagales bacterium]
MYYKQGLRLGILGGGQLGRMLIQAAVNLDLEIFVLDPDTDAPCRYLAKEFQVGSLKNYDTVYHFGKQVDILTIEIENVNVAALEQLEKEGIKVFPQPHVIKLVQDKGLQKDFYKQHHLPTAPYYLLQHKDELAQYLAFLPAVQKLRKEGYDGRGVHKIVSEKDYPNAFEQPSVLEQMIAFEKELAVIVARNANGDMAAFPAVEMDFHPEKNLVEYLFSPANIKNDIESKAVNIAIQVAENLGIIGLLAVEMFLTKDGEVLINEVAPRPHNSGHHTIEANMVSQYEQHLRAILNMPLGDTAIKLPAVMVNLLGEPGFEGPVHYEGLETAMAIPGVNIHLYGKKKTKPFRKMGHITITDPDLEKAKEKAQIVKQTLKAIT